MQRRCWLALAGAVAVLAGVFLTSCGRGSRREVVVFCALDSVYSEPVLREFERRTGLAVSPKFDSEATKTVGLTSILLDQHRRGPVRCDVFWNNEVMQTVRLKRAGALEPYVSPAAADIPGAFKDPDGHWTGFAARARVIVYNKNLVPERLRPRTIWALADPRWKGKAAIARPLAGTTATHAAALFSVWGEKQAKVYFEQLLANDVHIALGNANVRDLVVAGRMHIGLTDTDDVASAIGRGDPVGMIIPGQGDSPADMGTLVIPNTVAVMKGCPHPEEARKLVDYILSAEVEERLARCPSAQIPVRPGVPGGGVTPALDDIRAVAVDYEKVAAKAEEVAEYLRQNFRR